MTKATETNPMKVMMTLWFGIPLPDQEPWDWDKEQPEEWLERVVGKEIYSMDVFHIFQWGDEGNRRYGVGQNLGQFRETIYPDCMLKDQDKKIFMTLDNVMVNGFVKIRMETGDYVSDPRVFAIMERKDDV